MDESLRNDVKVDAHKREELATDLNAKIDGVIDRDSKLEVGGTQPPPTSQHPRSPDAKTANHLICGGWPDTADNASSTKDTDALLARCPGTLRFCIRSPSERGGGQRDGRKAIPMGGAPRLRHRSHGRRVDT